MFIATVDSKTNLSNVEKFTYLKGSLSSVALEAVSGLPHTNDSYLVASDLLFKRFGKTNLVVNVLYTKLVDLPAPSTKQSSLRKFMTT